MTKRDFGILKEHANRRGLSYNYLRLACLDGRLRHIRCGTKIMTRDEWVEDFLEREARGGSAE